MPVGADHVLVLLDPHCWFADLPPETKTYWAGLPRHPGRDFAARDVGEIRTEIMRVRPEASATRGWVVNSYLLRRP